MKSKYMLKKECSHCGHKFKFWNDSEKVIKRRHTMSVSDAAGLLGVGYKEEDADKVYWKLGWKYFYPCPNCGNEVRWMYNPEDED